MTNDLLRAHVTSTAFVLSLGKTHIAALVHLEEALAADLSVNDHITAARNGQAPAPKPPHLGNFTTGASGLIARGLVTHAYVPPRTDISDKPFSTFWQITKAGRLVLELLREAGVWQEYAVGADTLEAAA